MVRKVAEIREGDVLGFGIYKMDVTQQNIKNVDQAEWASPMNRALHGLPKNY